MKLKYASTYKKCSLSGFIISIFLADVSFDVYASDCPSEDLEINNNLSIVQPNLDIIDLNDIIGKEVIICNNHTQQYLDNNGGYAYTSGKTTDEYTGTRWIIIKNSENDYSFKSIFTECYLDTDGGKVYTSPSNDPKQYSGTHWEIIENCDTKKENDYSFKSIPDKIGGYLDNYNYTTGGGVYTSLYNTLPKYSGTRWKIGLVNISTSKICNIINNAYPKLTSKIEIVNIRADDSMHQTLTSSTVKNIWKNSNISKYTYIAKKLDCEDYVILFKSKVAEWISGQKQNTPSGTAFGIMFGEKEVDGIIKKHAYNFYITPYLELKLIKAQRGTGMKLDERTPYFCFM